MRGSGGALREVWVAWGTFEGLEQRLVTPGLCCHGEKPGGRETPGFVLLPVWVWPLFLIYKMGLGERLAYSVQAVEVDSHSSVPVAACRVGTNEDNLMTLLQFDHFH